MLKETPQLAPDGQPFRISTLRNSAGIVVTVMDWGATLLSCRVPMKDGTVRETLLGCETPEDYLNQAAYLGATVGRYANRIANSQFERDGVTVKVTANQGAHQLHGGPDGFDKRRWRIVRQNENEVLYTLDSQDGDQGFPGELRATARYALTEDNCITVEFRAKTSKPCPVNLTNHAYFNLDGQQNDIRQHRLQLLADSYLPVDSDGIPQAGLADVANTGFDFRTPKTIAADFLRDNDQVLVKGYDHAFLLQTQGDASQPAAHVWSSDNKLQMTVYTTAPALQFYSGNYLEGTAAREQGTYSAYQGLALESEFLPDSPNHPEWPQPDCWLQPEDEYLSITEYEFTPL
ncbi:aldose 1-epimerase [Buttiauxella brennerae ATCC 51605]|jgi:aldose 1-epimerase|uniref:Aldose 1-epimerase n=1 Tax=Buttiauxella brennerae ATCC 51605 TaxID=1354251 RepID=A0A1B7INA9_9ENTR|nr:galactose-1-epimerase [Buttiauxella brennerae]OAT31139.1 aldose 1-epimerase [Buttiauxella brennerae ATCC 51605]